MSQMDIDADRGLERRDDDDGEISEADSDIAQLQNDIARIEESVHTFLAQHRGNEPQDAVWKPRRRGAARGPRKAAEPSVDIKARLGQLTNDMLSGNLARAKARALEIIRINSEIQGAWNTLGAILRDEGSLDKGLNCLVYAAHLRPKDANGWVNCGDLAHEDGNLPTARHCYSAAVRCDANNIHARLGRARVYYAQGMLIKAISEFQKILESRPFDLDVVRDLAAACVDRGDVELVETAVSAYRLCFDHSRQPAAEPDLPMSWPDVSLYVELFACGGKYQEAIWEIRSLARWLLGRGDEAFWDGCLDDREWDQDNLRRDEILEFRAADRNPYASGYGLPLELRCRLALYRLCLGDLDEGYRHLSWLDPTEASISAAVVEFPFLITGIADELLYLGQVQDAKAYFELLHQLPGEADAHTFLQLGRCHLQEFNYAAAEEHLLWALEEDPDSIDARIELAKVYESTRENEEALILATEAIALQDAADHEESELGDDDGDGLQQDATREARSREVVGKATNKQRKKPSTTRSAPRTSVAQRPRGERVIKPRYRPRRLGDAEVRRQEERERAGRVSRQYESAQELKRRIRDNGETELMGEWMATAKELVDDFRSARKFYSWDKYLRFIGYEGNLSTMKGNQEKSQVALMVERLSKNLAPESGGSAANASSSNADSYQGISFGEWLELFLDYALSLALDHRGDEAYPVCEAARDATTFLLSKPAQFQIHVAWGACAVYLSDEETCVAVARFFMREYAFSSDSYRMFATLCRMSHSPISWYSSGPAQKYILRQIKAMDVPVLASEQYGFSGGPRGAGEEQRRIDICLLMLYGHILFTSTSYTYALNYFLRARALDPANPMVNLSAGLGYIHHALKRQSSNRQYLIIQGLALVFQCIKATPIGEGTGGSPESAYDAGRIFQILGLHHLAFRYYRQALESGGGDGAANESSFSKQDTELNAYYNIFTSNLLSRDFELAKSMIGII